ncbi:hypothetical protein [Halpernia sp.]|uniref:hypothetical protein n=1 Tax=Halpernia sp. TaxID=2782209 RepID=UPI003A92E3CD
MKTLLTVLSVALCVGFANAQQKNPLKTQTVKSKSTMKVVTAAKSAPTGVKLKKDGTPDKRYKNAKHLKKDGTIDKRYKK